MAKAPPVERTRLRIFISCVALLILASRAAAGIRPSFYLENCVWLATDIIVATQSDNAAASLSVLETWRGDMIKGARIEVIGLPVAPIKTSISFGLKSPVASVSGSRIVLFLRPAARRDDRPPATEPAIRQFEGTAQFGGAQVSAAWIEKDQAYAFQQIWNPGPSELHPLRQSEAELKKQTEAMLAAKAALEKSESIANPVDRAQALAPMTSSPYWHERKEAFAALARCGKPALPLLRKMLRDDQYEQTDVVRALSEAAGSDAGKEMTAILVEELPYWKSVGPTLKTGWWNADPADHRKVLRNRYDILDTDLRVLTKLAYPPSRVVVTQFRDFWSSLPQLNDQSGLDQITHECEAVLKSLDKPSSHPTER
jgi:hypothetical protein